MLALGEKINHLGLGWRGPCSPRLGPLLSNFVGCTPCLNTDGAPLSGVRPFSATPHPFYLPWAGSTFEADADIDIAACVTLQRSPSESHSLSS